MPADIHDRNDWVTEAAEARIERLAGDTSLEGLWLRAGAQALLTGELVDPPVESLKDLTTPERAWDCARWPAEVLRARGARLVDCQFLAMTLGDRPWLEQLEAGWVDAPVEDDWKTFVLGQIGFALRPGGRRPNGWTADDIEWFVEEKYLRHEEPADRAWLALMADDSTEAQRALSDYRAQLAEAASRRTTASHDQIHHMLNLPGEILLAQVRALATLIARPR